MCVGIGQLWTGRPWTDRLCSGRLCSGRLCTGQLCTGQVGPAKIVAAKAVAAKVVAVGAENEYANVISQVGGPYVSVSAVMSNPNTDPHEFEASARVAVEVSQAQLIVQNGVGYDSFMDKIEAAEPPFGPPGHRGPEGAPASRARSSTPICGTTPARCRLWPAPSPPTLSRLQPAHRALLRGEREAVR